MVKPYGKPLFFIVILLLIVTPSVAYAAPRNPFGVADVRDPVGSDIQKFAKGVSLAGGKNDPNAEQWVDEKLSMKLANNLDGDWQGRWESGRGIAKVRTNGDRVFVLYTDHEGRLKNKTWLLEAERNGNRLMGRWAQVGNQSDSGPYVGLIVDNERIDGTWGSGSRWDFRRRFDK